MDLREALKNVVEPGLALLPAKMDTPEARAMLLTIAMQESRLKYRKQIGGPAHGFYQFEKGGGIKGVLRYHSTKALARDIMVSMGLSPDIGVAYNEVVENDALATVFARLLLWTDPGKLPALDSDPDVSWDLYLRTWRPGKPHPETWPNFWMASTAVIASLDESTEFCPECGREKQFISL